MSSPTGKNQVVEVLARLVRTPCDNFEFQAVGLEPAHWSNANPVRGIFRDFYMLAGLPYFNPHSFRNMLGHLAHELKLDPESSRHGLRILGTTVA
jgi:integrase/recombinase XerD